MVLLPMAVATAPLWVPAAAVIDLAQGLRRLPTVRLGAMAVVYLAHEWICLTLAVGLVARDRLRPGRATVERLAPWRAVQGWWISSLLGWARRLLGLRFDLPDPPALPDGGFVLLSRHASMADAGLPLWLVAGLNHRWVHYVIKRELRFDPTLDIYGRRMGNHFIARTGDGDTEAAALAELSRRALPSAA